MRIPISQIPRDEETFSIPDAVVAYLDILGFAERKSERDMENCLHDFAGPLTLGVSKYRLRVNVFSDCAFVASPKKSAVKLLRTLRFAFGQWLADSMLVRGGIAIGNYAETITSYIDEIRTMSENFNSSLFWGSAVSAAVRVEASGPAALLFATRESAAFYQSSFGEPVYSLDDRPIIGWFDDPNTLYWFTSISLVRMLRLVSLRKGAEKRRVLTMLRNNLNYARTINPRLTRFVIMTILSSPIEPIEIRDKVRKSLGLPRPSPFETKIIKDWLRRRRKDFDIMIDTADMDSSISMRFWDRWQEMEQSHAHQ